MKSTQNPFGDDEDEDITLNGSSSAWGGIGSTSKDSNLGTTGNILKDTIQKEAVIKEILAGQEDLRGTWTPFAEAVHNDMDSDIDSSASSSHYSAGRSRQIAFGERNSSDVH
ncbi:hypothetical protein FRC03_000869 [Tulasnella sp. 419]|nr:hypothetical protein FRC03_000869 [Tulasnella sp. 419]